MGRILFVLSALPVLVGFFFIVWPFVHNQPTAALRTVGEFYLPPVLFTDAAHWVTVPPEHMAVGASTRPEPCSARCLVGTEFCQIDCGDLKGYEAECKDARTCKVRLFYDMSHVVTMIVLTVAVAPMMILFGIGVLVSVILCYGRWLDFTELDKLFDSVDKGESGIHAVLRASVFRCVYFKFIELDGKGTFVIMDQFLTYLIARIERVDSMPAYDGFATCGYITELPAFEKCAKYRVREFRCSRFGPRISVAFIRDDRTDGLMGYLKYRDRCYKLFKSETKKPKTTVKTDYE